MELESLFGLPAHPLLVHGAVVLVPLAAIGTILIVASTRLRRQLGVAVAVLAVVAFGFTFLSKQSGEPLEEQVDETEAVEEHAELGEVMPLFAGLLMLTSVGVVALDVYGRRSAGGSEDEALVPASAPGPGGPPSWLKPVATGVAVLAVLASIGATVEVVLVGHSGAEATWDEEGEEGEDGEHEGEDGEDEDDDDEGESDEEGMAEVGAGPLSERR